MGKKTKIIKLIISGIFLVFVLITFVSSYREVLQKIDMEEISGLKIAQKAILYIQILFMSFILWTLKHIRIVIIYIIIMVTKLKIKNDKKLAIDDKDIAYYREILKGYSPAELKYASELDLNLDSDIAATLLSLEYKGAIQLDKQNKAILIIDNNKKVSLNEKYILTHIKDGKLKDISKFEFVDRTLQDGENSGLLQPVKFNLKQKLKRNIKRIIIIFLCIIIMSILIRIVAPQQNISEIIAVIAITFFIIGLPAYIFIYNIIYLIRFSKIPYIRTNLGKEIAQQMEGLKKYLKDYSMLDEKDAEQIKLWGEYMIYSVLFKQNEEVTKEIIEWYTLDKETNIVLGFHDKHLQ